MRKKILFVTYYRLVPTGQIGIFKRCIRLISKMQSDSEIYLLNFGPLPDEDPLFASVRQNIHIYRLPHQNVAWHIERLYKAVKPDVLVIGETPLDGKMRLASKVGKALSIPQIGIENFYGYSTLPHYKQAWPHIDHWIMLGLLEDGRPQQTIGNATVIPPLVSIPPDSNGKAKDRICVIGYDKDTLAQGMDLVKRLPKNEAADIFTVKEYAKTAAAYVSANGKPLRVFALPPDDVLYGSMARAKFIYGKAGFQQVVEGIGLGAPVVCQKCGGGLDDFLVPPYLKPWVRFVDSKRDLEHILWDLTGWMGSPPKLKWQDMWKDIPDPMGYGADHLCRTIDSVTAS